MYKDKGGGSSRFEAGALDRKKINDVTDNHLERMSPSTSRGFSSKDKDGRFPAPSSSTARTPSDNRESRASASAPEKNNECSDVQMQTDGARSQGELAAPPGFVSHTAFILKRMACTDLTSFSTQEISSLEDMLDVNLPTKQKAWIVHDQLEHHEEETDHEPNHENIPVASEDCLPKGVIWGCSECSNCLKVPAQWDPEGACTVSVDEAPVFQPTVEEFKDTLKYIESICQQVKPFGFCRIVPPPSWQPSRVLVENNACRTMKLTTQVQRINEFGTYSKRKGLASMSIQETKRRRISQLDSDNDAGSCDAVGSSVMERSQFQFGPQDTLESFKKQADYFKECFFSRKSKIMNPEASHAPCHEQGDPSEEDIEGEYWRILEKPTAEIEVFCGAIHDSESLRNTFLESSRTEASDSIHYQDSGWNLSNLCRLPGSLLSFENSDYSGDLGPQIHMGMCFSTVPWEVQEHHLYSLYYLHVGAPRIWYGVPGHYFKKIQEAVEKQVPGIFDQRPELLCKLGMQVSPATLQAEGIPVHRSVQRPKEFMLFLPGSYHTGFGCGFNVSESVSFAPLDWLPHGLSVVELYRDKRMKPLISNDKLLLGAAHEAVTAYWEVVVKHRRTDANLTWKAACYAGSVIGKTLKVRVKSEARQRKYLCTGSQSRKMDKFFDMGARKACWRCNFNLYLSAAFCPCSPDKYACLKHTKYLCRCAWSNRVFLHRFDISELNLLVEATEGSITAVHRWVKQDMAKVLEDDTERPNVQVISEDATSVNTTLEQKGETSSFSEDGTNVKDAPKKKLLSESMARILEALPVGASQLKCIQSWNSTLYDSSSESDDERYSLPILSKGKQSLPASHSASNGEAAGSSKLGHEKQEKKSSGKSEDIICLSSDDEA